MKLVRQVIEQTLKDNLKSANDTITKKNKSDDAEGVDFVEPSDMKKRVELATSVKANL